MNAAGLWFQTVHNPVAKHLERRHRGHECSVSYMLMNKLDWKSFAIGVLLTTTVMFGTGATSPSDKWIHLAFPSPDSDEFGNKEFANKINQLENKKLIG